MKEPVGIDERDALTLHDRLLALHGGAVGLRDDGLLKSAMARPQQHFAYAESPDIVDMAAAYTWGIVRNHPFVDGNKRTGFVVGVLFLELNIASTLARKTQRKWSWSWRAGTSRKQAISLFFALMHCSEKNETVFPCPKTPQKRTFSLKFLIRTMVGELKQDMLRDPLRDDGSEEAG